MALRDLQSFGILERASAHRFVCLVDDVVLLTVFDGLVIMLWPTMRMRASAKQQEKGVGGERDYARRTL